MAALAARTLYAKLKILKYRKTSCASERWSKSRIIRVGAGSIGRSYFQASPIKAISSSFPYLLQRGCVTPTQIQNAKTSIEDDIDNLEGYDEIPPEIQVKIKDAIEQGHVADEDWIGVST